MNFYYEGILRMDWGFGNPNRTAALIACLMVASWGLAYFKRWGFWAASIIFTGLGFALVQTFSRGGIAALATGGLILLAFAPRPWRRYQAVTVFAIIGILVSYAFFSSATERVATSWQGDGSVLNRLELWQHVPKMIVDSPNGWGLGNSQNAYMHWYQGVDRGERFLNLVSLHLSLMAELGWPLRVAYIALWIFALIITYPGKVQSLTIPFAILVTFFIAGIFTHFVESWPVYLPPSIALLAGLFIRLRNRDWISRPMLASGVASVVALVTLIYLIGSLSKFPTIRGDRHHVVVGQTPPMTWVIIDPTVLGRDYGKTLRRFLAQHPNSPSLGFVAKVGDAPQGCRIVLPGKSGLDTPALLQHLKSPQLVLLNSELFPQHLNAESQKTAQVFFGEFSRSNSQQIWLFTAKSQILPGVGDYLPEWPALLLANP